MSMSKTKMQHVPYKGSSAAHPDLLAGRTTMIFDPMPAIRGHVKSGALRGLAVTTTNRSSAFPDTPAGTPRDIVLKLNVAVNDALKMDDVRTRLSDAGIEIQSGTPEHFGNVIKSEVDKWGRITKEAGIVPEQ